ncbi:MAG: hypothetical protein HPY82_07215 [Gammaproteobacteria bacterium]|nr:hypothetical protein [Gammaproteobacteria bacterium]
MKRHIKPHATGLLLAFCFSLSGCDNGAVVAKVDDEKITAEELVAEVNRRGLPLQETVLQQVLEQMIDRSAAAIKADALELMDEPDFQRAYRTLALETLQTRFQADWDAELTVSETDIKAEYDRDQSRYTRPEQIRVALIEFEAGHERAAQLEQVSTLQAQLQAAHVGDERDQLFQSLAVQHSADRASRYRGGDVGFLQRDETSRWPAPVTNAAFALTHDGDLSAPVETESAIYLIKLVNRRDAFVEPLQSVRGDIRQRLITARFDALKARSKEKLREDLKVRLFPAAIAAIGAEKVAPAAIQSPPGPALN